MLFSSEILFGKRHFVLIGDSASDESLSWEPILRWVVTNLHVNQIKIH